MSFPNQSAINYICGSSGLTLGFGGNHIFYEAPEINSNEMGAGD
jgi:hypothetical protein